MDTINVVTNARYINPPFAVGLLSPFPTLVFIVGIGELNTYGLPVLLIVLCLNTPWPSNILIHSRALLAAIHSWLAAL